MRMIKLFRKFYAKLCIDTENSRSELSDSDSNSVSSSEQEEKPIKNFHLKNHKTLNKYAYR